MGISQWRWPAHCCNTLASDSNRIWTRSIIISNGGDTETEPYCLDLPITLNQDGPPGSTKQCSKRTARCGREKLTLRQRRGLFGCAVCCVCMESSRYSRLLIIGSCIRTTVYEQITESGPKSTAIPYTRSLFIRLKPRITHFCSYQPMGPIHGQKVVLSRCREVHN